MAMTIGAMVQTALKMHNEGLTNVEIAKRLADKGYISPRTKRPISAFGVGHHIRAATSRKAPPMQLAAEKSEAPRKAVRHNGKLSKIDLALEIMANDELDYAIKKELAGRILNS
jgi:hypothetical protein